ncbi:5-hydroxyisourate hydrolase-like [Rhynchocyon petersi]
METPSSPQTTHVLDTALGLPARDLHLSLYRPYQLPVEGLNQKCMELRKSHTDGRCPGLLEPGQMKEGIYKLSFHTEDYWRKRRQESFYPYMEVVFTVNKMQKFHVPLLLSPWSYTTYRGS